MTLAISRIIEIDRGQLIINGEDTRYIRLSDLRKKLSVIPQEPFIYEGTL